MIAQKTQRQEEGKADMKKNFFKQAIEGINEATIGSS